MHIDEINVQTPIFFNAKKERLVTAWQACGSYGFTIGIPAAVQVIRFP
jgi:hypothetical protein